MDKAQWIGGQAVLEGVMMRHRNRMAVACRCGDGSITVYSEKLLPLSRRFPPFGWPLLRGAVAFFESLILGVRSLNISASLALTEEGEELKSWLSWVTVLFGLGLGVGLFFVLPTFLAGFLPPLPPVLLNLVEGMIRLAVFMLYLYLISRWRDVQRVFEYHGAEHKAIYGYEDGAPLKPESLQRYSTRHPRCGTSFILIVMVISILLFSLFGWQELWRRITVRLVLLPLIAGISYEAIRLTARGNSLPVRWLAVPGLALQGLTTREPDRGQVEVALAALQAVLGPEAVKSGFSAEGRHEVKTDV